MSHKRRKISKEALIYSDSDSGERPSAEISNEEVIEVTTKCITVTEIVGMTLEVLLVFDQIHDFGEEEDRNILSTRNCMHLKVAQSLLDTHWERIKKRYKGLHKTPLFTFLFKEVDLRKVVYEKKYKYKIARKIIEEFHNTRGQNLISNTQSFDGWKSQYLVDIFAKFIKDTSVTKLYVDCSGSKYNIYPILHYICDNSFKEDDPDDDKGLTVVKSLASIYDPCVSNSIESYINSLKTVSSKVSVSIETMLNDSEQRYTIKTDSGNCIVDFTLALDRHYLVYDIDSTPDSYLSQYTHRDLCVIQKILKAEGIKCTQQDFIKEPLKYINEARVSTKIGAVHINNKRVRCTIHSFLEQTSFVWSDPDQPFKNVSVRNVSEYVLQRFETDNTIKNTLAYKTIGDLAQIVESSQNGGLFISVDEIAGYISSLIGKTLIERDNDHVLCALVYYAGA